MTEFYFLNQPPKWKVDDYNFRSVYMPRRGITHSMRGDRWISLRQTGGHQGNLKTRVGDQKIEQDKQTGDEIRTVSKIWLKGMALKAVLRVFPLALSYLLY